jgi:hypothetical protein
MHQYYGKVAEWSKAAVCKTVKSSVQIRPLPPNMEVWQSPVYCNSLENCRVERHREFESHRFRQIGEKNVGTYNNADNGILLGIVWCYRSSIFTFDVRYSNNLWSVGRVGRRHFPAKKAYPIRVSLVRIQYTPPLDKVFRLTYNVYYYLENEVKAKTNKLNKPRNFVAKDLFTPKYRMKVEVNSYNRASEKQTLRKQNVYI